MKADGKVTDCLLHTLVSSSAYCTILKMETIYSSETLVYFERTTRRHISEFIIKFVVIEFLLAFV
jgi:hypothetical protein